MEILARADASAARCASILSEGGFYAGFLEEGTPRKLFPDLDARCAGMLATLGRAEEVPGGYRVEEVRVPREHSFHVPGVPKREEPL